MTISIVVPVHNEAENIQPLLDEIVVALLDFDAYEIIYINDGSSDATAQVLAKAQKNLPHLRVFEHQKSCGQSAAVYTGIKAAKYPFIATLDGDGQNNPADIPSLFEHLKSQREITPKLAMIAGWRNKRHDSAWRLFSSGAMLGASHPYYSVAPTF